MKIAVIGTGYVGLSTGVCLSEVGHHVTCMDINEQKIKDLRAGISPIYEPGLEHLLSSNMSAGRLHFTTSHQEGLKDAEVIILAVGTPQGHDGAADLTYLEQAAKDISPFVTASTIIVIKSTVPVGTNDNLKKIIEGYCGFSIQMASNPEFLRQGSAIQDTLKADRIVIGTESKGAAQVLSEMYQPLQVPIVLTDTRSAEMIKYASNAFLATKISYINEIANLCEAVGANVEDVARGVGKDYRIGSAFLQAGIGYGGSCFPKDVKALLHTAGQHGVDFSMLKETITINDYQHQLLVKKAMKRFGDLKGKKIAILGLSFKPETDDMREAPSIKIAQLLTELGAEVVAYDPVATNNARIILKDTIIYADSVDAAVKKADAIMLVTEWKEFKQLDVNSLVKKLKQPIIFDGRNCWPENQIRSCEHIEYYPVGRREIIK
jgi:UDPglucose 6-dehydrogenase